MELTSLHSLPEWSVDQWFNTPEPINLSDLRGKVVLIETFQMLCPGCVSQSLPLAKQAHEIFPKDKFAVIGLHTVFEHHDAMTPVSLKAFLHEYRISFPVGVDTPGNGGAPITMERYGLRGTPSLLLVDALGNLRKHHFGQMNALQLGAEIATLLGEPILEQATANETNLSRCDENGCLIT